MSKLSLLTPTLLFPILLLSGCGGGGSNTPAKPSENPSSLSASSLSSLPFSSLSSLPFSSSSSNVFSSSADSSAFSSVVADSSSLASSSVANNITLEKVSGVIEYTDVNGSAIEVDDAASVAITLSLLNEQDEVINSKSVAALSSPAESNSLLSFSGELTGANAKFLVIQISKAGFTDYARRFDVAAELNVKATLSQVPSEIISESTAVTISGEEVDGFNFSVSDKDDPEAAGASGGIADLTVSIPKSALPAGTTSIDVKMQAFNPNDAKDAERFPGAYADSDGNKLLSVAFNYTDITTNSGVSLRKMAASAKGNQSLLQKLGWKKTEAEPVIINRKIPSESCSALKQMGDSSKELAGFQVPIYTYNSGSGLWDLLGQGTVYSDQGEAIAEDFKAFDCTASDYVLEIKVTNEIFLSNWWNLDYPLVFTQPVKLCADVQLVDEASYPIANTMVYIHDDDNERSFSAENFVTDNEGKLHIETFSLDSVPADFNVELLAYPRNYRSSIEKSITLSTSCAVSTPVVIKTTVPAACKVEGVLKDQSGAALAKSPLYAVGSGDVFAMPAFGVTDSQGKYSLDVDCNQSYNLVDYFSWLTAMVKASLKDYRFAVNASVNDDEKSDDGRKVVMQDLIADHSKPLGYAFSEYKDNANQIQVQFMYAGNAYPLSYSFDAIDPTTNKVYGHFAGTLTKSDLLPEDNIYAFPHGAVLIPNTVVWPTEYLLLAVRGTIKDASGSESALAGYLYDAKDQDIEDLDYEDVDYENSEVEDSDAVDE